MRKANAGAEATLSVDIVRIADAEQLRRVAGGDERVIVGADVPSPVGATRVERVSAQAAKGRDREWIGLDRQSPQQFDRVDSIVVTAELAGEKDREFPAPWWAGGTPARPVLRITRIGGRAEAAAIAAGMAAAYARAGMMERGGTAEARVRSFVTTHMVGRADGAAELLGDSLGETFEAPLGARFEVEIGQAGACVRVVSPGIPTREDARDIAGLLAVARHYVEAGDEGAQRNRTRDADGRAVPGDSPRAASWSLWDAVFTAAEGITTERITNVTIDQLAHAAHESYGRRVPAGQADAGALMRWSDSAGVGDGGAVITRTPDELVDRIDRVREAMLVVAGGIAVTDSTGSADPRPAGTP